MFSNDITSPNRHWTTLYFVFFFLLKKVWAKKHSSLWCHKGQLPLPGWDPNTQSQEFIPPLYIQSVEGAGRWNWVLKGLNLLLSGLLKGFIESCSTRKKYIHLKIGLLKGNLWLTGPYGCKTPSQLPNFLVSVQPHHVKTIGPHASNLIAQHINNDLTALWVQEQMSLF